MAHARIIYFLDYTLQAGRWSRFHGHTFHWHTTNAATFFYLINYPRQCGWSPIKQKLECLRLVDAKLSRQWDDSTPGIVIMKLIWRLPQSLAGPFSPKGETVDWAHRLSFMCPNALKSVCQKKQQDVDGKEIREIVFLFYPFAHRSLECPFHLTHGGSMVGLIDQWVHTIGHGHCLHASHCHRQIMSH